MFPSVNDLVGYSEAKDDEKRKKDAADRELMIEANERNFAHSVHRVFMVDKVSLNIRLNDRNGVLEAALPDGMYVFYTLKSQYDNPTGCVGIGIYCSCGCRNTHPFNVCNKYAVGAALKIMLRKPCSECGKTLLESRLRASSSMEIEVG